MAELYENKDKSIMCPNCNKLLVVADKRDPREHRVACKHCRKWIWYVATHEYDATIHEMPDRMSASGKRYY